MQGILGAPVRIKYVITNREAAMETVTEKENDDHHVQIIESAASMFEGKTVRKKS